MKGYILTCSKLQKREPLIPLDSPAQAIFISVNAVPTAGTEKRERAEIKRTEQETVSTDDLDRQKKKKKN